MAEKRMTKNGTDKKIVTGVKQTMRMIEQGRVSELLIAEDADFFVTRAILEAGLAANIPVRAVDSKKDLGRMCGIEIGAATAGILRD